MTFPSFQHVIESLTANIGWGTVAASILTGLGFIGRLLWTLTTNHAEHIQAATERIEQKTDTLIALTQAQNVFVASTAQTSKETAVALAKIETLLSVNKVQ